MYYKITYKEIPKLLFAHKYEVNRYEMEFRKTPVNIIELTYIEKGTLYFSNGKIMPEGTLNLAVFDRNVSGISRNAPHCHFTVGIIGGKCEPIGSEKLRSELYADSDSEDFFFVAGDTAFMPKTSARAKELIRELIAMQLMKNSKSAILPKMFALFDLISKDTISSLLHENDIHTYSDYRYCDQARAYISEHIYEKIHIKDIAGHLSLSEGHLSRIFKAVTSDTLIEYINKTKIEAICGILDNVGGTTAELSELFSICDEKYLRRLFRKYKGMSITEYKKMRFLKAYNVSDNEVLHSEGSNRN